MKSTTLSQIFVTAAWTAILAMAIAVRKILPEDPPILSVYIQTVLLVALTFLTTGIRLIPGFRQGLYRTIADLCFCSTAQAGENDIDTDSESMDDPVEGSADKTDDSERKSKPSNANKVDDQEDYIIPMQDVEHGTKTQGGGQEHEGQQKGRKTSPRVYFLDNVRIFLTALVVVFHVVQAFDAMEGRFWFAIGTYDNTFGQIALGFVALCRGFFMPLFYFMSAYFVPRSYNKKGEDAFLYDRALRLFVPGIAEIFVFTPLVQLIAQGFAGIPFSYVPRAGVTWFTLWLLIFSFVYHTYRKADRYAVKFNTTKVEDRQGGMEREEGGAVASTVFPSWWKRMLAGSTICGLLMYAFVELVDGGSFYTMPIALGSFTCNILFFAVGIYASQEKWLESPILPHPSSWLCVGMTVPIEFALGGGLWLLNELGYLNDNWQALAFLFFGLYCVDMSTLVLALFQRFANKKPGKFGQFLSSSAYTVYLIHRLFVTAWTGVFVKTYNAICGYDVIVFGGDTAESASHLLGPGNGSLHLFTGCLIVSILCLVTVWPIAYAIRSIPFLNRIL